MENFGKGRRLENGKMATSVVDVVKNFYGGNLDFPKFKKLNKVCSNVLKCTKI